MDLENCPFVSLNPYDVKRQTTRFPATLAVISKAHMSADNFMGYDEEKLLLERWRRKSCFRKKGIQVMLDNLPTFDGTKSINYVSNNPIRIYLTPSRFKPLSRASSLVFRWLLASDGPGASGCTVFLPERLGYIFR